jgi:molecular chaperone DnaK
MKLGEAMYKAQQGEAGDGEASADGAHAEHGEDVVDAEFEEVDGDDHKK